MIYDLFRSLCFPTGALFTCYAKKIAFAVNTKQIVTRVTFKANLFIQPSSHVGGENRNRLVKLQDNNFKFLKDDTTPLILASAGGHSACVMELLEQGADVNAKRVVR